jgi:hypothetical protein
MAKEYINKSSIPLTISETEIKKTLRVQLTQSDYLSSRKQTANTSDDMAKRSSLHCCLEYKLVKSLWKSVFMFQIKSKT